MSVKNLFLKIIGFIGLFFSAVFYVLFKQKKDELKQEQLEQAEKEKERAELLAQENAEQNKIINEALDASVKDKKEYEEQLQNAIGGNKLNNFYSGVDLLSK